MSGPAYTLRALDKAFVDDFEVRHKQKHPAATVERKKDKIKVKDEVLIYGEPASPGDPPPIVGKKEGPEREVDRYILESDVMP